MYRLLLALPPDVPGPDGGSGGSGMGGLLIFLLPLLILFILMPLFNKKEKHRRQRLQGLKKHDRVVTSGGIYGTIMAMDDGSVTLEVAKDVRLRIKRSSVFDLETPQDTRQQQADQGARRAKAKS